MTMVFRQVPPGHASRCPDDDVILAVDNITKNVIHFQRVAESASKGFEFPVVHSHFFILQNLVLIMLFFFDGQSIVNQRST